MSDAPLTTDQRLRREFVMITNGEDKALDALHVAYTALAEIEDGDALEAAIRYLISRFAIRIGHQIRQGGRYGCTHCD